MDKMSGKIPEVYKWRSDEAIEAATQKVINSGNDFTLYLDPEHFRDLLFHLRTADHHMRKLFDGMIAATGIEVTKDE